jgi:hypothetical protein
MLFQPDCRGSNPKFEQQGIDHEISQVIMACWKGQACADSLLDRLRMASLRPTLFSSGNQLFVIGSTHPLLPPFPALFLFLSPFFIYIICPNTFS